MGHGMASPVLLALILMTVTVYVHRTSGQISWFTQVPEDTIMLQGDSVVLHCQLDIRRIVEHGEYKVVWSKDNRELNFTDPAHANYWLTGDHHSAQYYLLISNASLQDTGAFSCAVFQNLGTGTDEDQWVMHAVTTVMVQVILRPGPPECRKADLDAPSNQTDINYEGDLIELACTGFLSHPSFVLQMTWNNQVITEADGAWVHIDDRQVQEQAYRFNADYRDNGASFSCNLYSPEFPDYSTSCEMVALNILHEPKLDFVLDNTEVRQGESLVVACLTVSNPSRVSFSWHMEPMQAGVVYREEGRILEIPSVSSSTGDLNITCLVSNDHGTSITSRLVQVLNNTETEPTQPEVSTPTEVPQLTTTKGSTRAPATQVGIKPTTKPGDKDTTTAAVPPTKSYYGGALSTSTIALLVIVPIIIIIIVVLVLIFMYKTIKLSIKRRDDQIRVVYQDGATVIDRHTHGGRGNLNLTVHPAVNEGAVVPTEGMEPGSYSMPPPYTKGDLPSMLDITSDTMAAGGQDAMYSDEKDAMYSDEKRDNTYVDMQAQF